MNAQESFYINLFSNTKDENYKDNKTSSFVVQLPKEIKLDGDYEIAASQISFPNTINNVVNAFIKICSIGEITDNKITTGKTTQTKTLKIVIPDAHCRTNEELVLHVNREFNKLFKHNLFELNGNRAKLSIKRKSKPFITTSRMVDEKWVSDEPAVEFLLNDSVFEHRLIKVLFHNNHSEDIFSSSEKTVDGYSPFYVMKQYTDQVIKDEKILSISLSPLLAKQFGFETDDDIFNFEEAREKMNLSIGLPNYCLLYSDLVGYQFVSNKMAQVVRIFPLDHKVAFGYTYSIEFFHRNYHELNSKSFQTIKIELRTELGNLLPLKHGTCCCTFHIRKKIL